MNHEDTKDTKRTEESPLEFWRRLHEWLPSHCFRHRRFDLLILLRIFVLFVSLWLIIASTPARAQSFGPPVATELVLVLLDREGSVRFTLSGYYTEWENPFRITVYRYSDLLDRRVAGHFRLQARTPVSPLFEGKYVLSRHWSVGFWYNPIRGERLEKTVQVAEFFPHLKLARDTGLADFHVIYTANPGLTAQLGYYHESGTIRDLNGALGGPTNYTLVSWNFWLTQRLDVLVPGRLTSGRLDAQLIPFVSLGYHPSTGLDHATSVLTGVAVTFGQKISLSGSVWLFDLRNTATRVTGGVVIQY
jgi:hypothetical protein